MTGAIKMLNIKNFIVLFFTIICIAFICSCQESSKGDDVMNKETVFSIKDNLEFIYTTGRCAVTQESITCDWGGSGFSFNADCEGNISLHYIKDSEQDVFFTVYIDGVRSQQRVKLSGKEGWCSIGENLDKRTHFFEIYKQTEIKKGFLCEFDMISMKGDFADPPACKDILIEFLGDSITAGIGNLGRNGIDGGEPINSDTTQTYAFIAGRELNADFSIIAQGGASLTPNTGTGIHLASVYDYVSFERNKLDHWRYDRHPDIIVVNLGTNDRSVGSDIFVNGVKTLGSMLRSYHKHAKIVFCIGMMQKGERTVEFKRAIKQLGGEEANYFFLMLPTNNEGSGAHPSVNGNKEAAKTLIEFLDDFVK